jgi:hypothetical protein
VASIEVPHLDVVSERWLDPEMRKWVFRCEVRRGEIEVSDRDVLAEKRVLLHRVASRARVDTTSSYILRTILPAVRRVGERLPGGRYRVVPLKGCIIMMHGQRLVCILDPAATRS